YRGGADHFQMVVMSAYGGFGQRYRRKVQMFMIAVVVAAAAFGLLAHRYLAARGGSGAVPTAEGLAVSDLLNPIRTLVALVLAFVLVQTFASFQDASDAAGNEAGAVSAEAQAAS